MIAIPFSPLIRGILLKRHQRFLADVRLADGRVVVAHTANTGAMLGCSTPGRPVYLSQAANPKRRCAYTWEMIQMESGLVGVNTCLPNRLAALAAIGGFFPDWPKNPAVTKEAKVGRGRLDLRLDPRNPKDPKIEEPAVFVEVKNCSYGDGRGALFPDAKSQRALKHLRELTSLVESGSRAVLLVLVQREAEIFRPAAAIDPDFALGLKQAVAAGVELMAYKVALSLTEARLAEPLAIDLD